MSNQLLHLLTVCLTLIVRLLGRLMRRRKKQPDTRHHRRGIKRKQQPACFAEALCATKASTTVMILSCWQACPAGGGAELPRGLNAHDRGLGLWRRGPVLTTIQVVVDLPLGRLQRRKGAVPAQNAYRGNRAIGTIAFNRDRKTAVGDMFFGHRRCKGCVIRPCGLRAR